MLLDGFKNTLIITFGALLIGIVLGTTVAVIKFLAAEKVASACPMASQPGTAAAGWYWKPGPRH